VVHARVFVREHERLAASTARVLRASIRTAHAPYTHHVHAAQPIYSANRTLSLFDIRCVVLARLCRPHASQPGHITRAPCDAPPSEHRSPLRVSCCARNRLPAAVYCPRGRQERWQRLDMKASQLGTRWRAGSAQSVRLRGEQRCLAHAPHCLCAAGEQGCIYVWWGEWERVLLGVCRNGLAADGAIVRC
jgi:hypothetical protein